MFCRPCNDGYSCHLLWSEIYLLNTCWLKVIDAPKSNILVISKLATKCIYLIIHEAINRISDTNSVNQLNDISHIVYWYLHVDIRFGFIIVVIQMGCMVFSKWHQLSKPQLYFLRPFVLPRYQDMETLSLDVTNVDHFCSVIVIFWIVTLCKNYILVFIQYIAWNWPWYSLPGLHIRITWLSLYGIRIPLFSLYGIHMPLFPYMVIQPIVLGVTLLWAAMVTSQWYDRYCFAEYVRTWARHPTTPWQRECTAITDFQSIDSL